MWIAVIAMPKKKLHLPDDERAKRIREAAHEIETDNDPVSFERAFTAVARGARKPKNRELGKK
jgi:hypothetical protein